MDNFETEEQQIEAIKKWWLENYKMVIVAVVLGLGSIVGVQAWKQQKLINADTASVAYDHISQSITQSPETPVSARVDTMMNDFGDSPYSSLSALMDVKALVNAGDLQSAEKKLQWVIEHTRDPSLGHIARLRLATVLSARGSYEAALKVLDVETGKFKPGYMELRGDILVSLGRTEEAKTAYDEALQAYAAIGARAQVLQLKRNDLSNS